MLSLEVLAKVHNVSSQYIVIGKGLKPGLEDKYYNLARPVYPSDCFHQRQIASCFNTPSKDKIYAVLLQFVADYRVNDTQSIIERLSFGKKRWEIGYIGGYRYKDEKEKRETDDKKEKISKKEKKDQCGFWNKKLQNEI